MKIIIKEREVEYDTDYPNGWKFSAGDPYKVPVMINDYKCFVKRFEKKTATNIPGWPLLNALKGKYEPNIPRVYDCREALEKDQSIHYVFYECIDGKTLEKAIEDKDQIDLAKLTDDLFSGMKSIHGQGFWFADFCEKNIFCEDGGRFLLIDLDSTEPATELPNNEIYGSKDYWIPVYKFYKEALNKDGIKLNAISGASLNYLQIIYLILHLKEFQENKGANYKADEQYEKLPSLLAQKSTAAAGYFLQALQFSTPTPEFIAGIRNLIHNDVLGTPAASIPVDQNKPVIQQFTADRTKIKAGESFMLQWQTENADTIELYRNGELIERPAAGQQQIQRTEFKDGATRDVSYQLIVSNKAGQIKSNPIIISKKNPTTKKTGILWIGGLAAAAIIAFLLLNKKTTAPLNIQVSSTVLMEDSLVQIVGDDLPTQSRINVFIDRVKAPILLGSANDLLVRVPSLELKSGMLAHLEIESDDVPLFSQSLPYQPNIAVYGMNMPNLNDGTSTITINGKNLHLGRVSAYLKNTAWNDSVSGEVSNIDKDHMTISFNRADVHAFNHPSPVDIAGTTNGFIQAFYQEALQLHRINERISSRVYDELLTRFPTLPTYTVVSHLSLSIQIDDQPKYYQLFDSYKINHVEGSNNLSVLLDTIVLLNEPVRRINR